MIHFLRSGGAGVMWARLESPRASYATPDLQPRTTRASRRRQLPTNHGHAALPLATRVYQPDSSSKTPYPPLRAVALRNPCEKRGSDPPKISLDGRSFHIRAGWTSGPTALMGAVPAAESEHDGADSQVSAHDTLNALYLSENAIRRARSRAASPATPRSFFGTSTSASARSARFRHRPVSRSSSAIRLSRGSATGRTGPRCRCRGAPVSAPRSRAMPSGSRNTNPSGIAGRPRRPASYSRPPRGGSSACTPP
jgi:hypothetical protein